jgi:hypothetical protein
LGVETQFFQIKKGNKMMTVDQENRIVDLVRDAIRALSFLEDDAQKIINADEQMKLTFQKLGVVDKRFGLARRCFDFMVPLEYKYETQIDTFVKKTKGLNTTHDYDSVLTSENFAKATNELEPGKTYRVRIFPILSRVSSNDCLTFLKKQNAIFVGVQGLILLQDQSADEFPFGKWVVSFDKKDALWKDSNGKHRVPSVRRYSDCWLLDAGFFGCSWHSDHCLVCFCDL